MRLHEHAVIHHGERGTINNCISHDSLNLDIHMQIMSRYQLHNIYKMQVLACFFDGCSKKTSIWLLNSTSDWLQLSCRGNYNPDPLCM